MLTKRPGAERGRTSIGWLESRHSFSFGEWYDPARMGFRSLRVINDDVVAPGGGFDTHGHRDMEIVTIVLKGALRHRDSLGHEEVLRAGEVQAMSAGSGIRHGEWNDSGSEPVHFLQVWVVPAEKGTEPRYAQRAIAEPDRLGRLAPVVAGGTLADPAALPIGQNARVSLGAFRAGESVHLRLAPNHAAYLHVARGSLEVNGVRLEAGDAVSVEGEPEVHLVGMGLERSDVLVFELA